MPDSKNDDQEKEVPASPPKIKKALPHHVIESNPFTTTKEAINKLFTLNTTTFIGVAVVSILLFFIAVLTAVAVMVAVAAFLIHHIDTAAGMAPMQLHDLAGNLNDTGIYATWFIGAPLFVGLLWLAKALQLRLVTATADGIEISFGAALKQSFGRILPLLWLDLLLLVALFVIVSTLALLGQVVGLVIIPISLAATAAIFYVAFRLLFAVYAIVGEQRGPIDAIKRSWAISRGHLAETVGIVATAGLVTIVPIIVLNSIVNAVSGSIVLAGIIGLLEFLVMVTIATLAMMGIAERFVQLRDVADGKRASGKTHVSNFVAILLALLASTLAGASNPHYSFDQNGFGERLKNSQQHWRQRSLPSSQDLFDTPDGQPSPPQTPPNFY